MSNIKVTAALLEAAGWTEAQVDRYYKLLSRKQTHGLGALTVSDRRFYNSALPACAKAQTAIDKAIREGQTRRVSGKQPVETKLHYRWLQFEVGLFGQLAELLPGEELAGVIIKTEYLRALEIYQPVLDQVDTAQRNKFTQTEMELVALAQSIGRCFPYDFQSHKSALQVEFPESWSPAWATDVRTHWATGAALTGEAALEFRALVRPVVEEFVRSLPSVRSVVAA